MDEKAKYYKYQINTLALNIVAILVFIILDITVSYTFNWHFEDINEFHFLLIILWFIIHELLHYVGFLTDKSVSPKDLLLGMRIEVGILYCMCKKPIGKRSILVALNFPLFFIGILTMAIAYIIKSSPLMLLSMINISGAVGDIIMSIQMSKMPKNIKYVDGDDSTGYYILSENDISNIKLPFVKLTDSGLYEPEKILSKETRKVIITKKSYVFLVAYLMIFVLLMFL